MRNFLLMTLVFSSSFAFAGSRSDAEAAAVSAIEQTEAATALKAAYNNCSLEYVTKSRAQTKPTEFVVTYHCTGQRDGLVTIEASVFVLDSGETSDVRLTLSDIHGVTKE